MNLGKLLAMKLADELYKDYQLALSGHKGQRECFVDVISDFLIRQTPRPEGGASKLLTVAQQTLEKLKYLEAEGIVQMPMTILALQQAILEEGPQSPQPEPLAQQHKPWCDLNRPEWTGECTCSSPAAKDEQ